MLGPVNILSKGKSEEKKEPKSTALHTSSGHYKKVIRPAIEISNLIISHKYTHTHTFIMFVASRAYIRKES